MMRIALDAASQQLFLRMQQEQTPTASLLNYIWAKPACKNYTLLPHANKLLFATLVTACFKNKTVVGGGDNGGANGSPVRHH